MKAVGIKTVAILLLLVILQVMQFFVEPQKTSKIQDLPTIENSQNLQTVSVVKVVDGDTIQVTSGAKKETVRIIGINTPETVDPRREVECFGLEASNKASTLLSGQNIRLEMDPTQGDRDRYGRLLRFVNLSDGTDFGLKMIKEGFAYEYTYDKPYKYQSIYKKAQQEAEGKGVGLWAENVCSNVTQE